MKSMTKRFIAGLLAVLLCFIITCPVLADATLTHGTADTLITEDMLDLAVPSDYEVNEDMQADASEGLYDRFFLKDGIQTVEITLDENNLNYLLQNAADKPSVLTQSVTIGGETIYYTGLKTKGNYTLSHAVSENAGSDRFSFTINFGKYVKKADFGHTQNFYGCNKISFNNFFFDKSMLKEYMALSLMTEVGVPTPQYGLAKLYINEEYYGVYFMVEAFDSSILEQYYGVDDDELSPYLTKPENTKLHYEDLLEDDSPLWENDEEVYADVADMLPTVMEWVRKLNLLSEGKDFDGQDLDVNSDEYLTLLGEIMDVDEALRYFAAHSWLCQMDNMFVTYQNFGLYVDEDGRSVLIPWDYDLSFGCYYPSESESTANFNIDAMFSNGYSANMTTDQINAYYEDYPLFHVIYQNESLREQYHTYMKDCSKIAALGGTTSFGTSYNPAYFASFVTTLQTDLVAAASEQLADHVYYMNNISQPSDVGKALGNVSKIIAMRSLGVAAQVDGLDATVCGAGCDLSTLGNANAGQNSSSGNLLTIDAGTGIYVLADYGASTGNGMGNPGGPGANARGGAGNRNGGSSPTLTVSTLSADDTDYQAVAEQLDAQEQDLLVVYVLNAAGSPEGDYTLSIPVMPSQVQADEEISFYSYADGQLTELTMTAEDNIYSTTLESLGTVVMMQKGEAELLAAASTTAATDTASGGTDGSGSTVAQDGTADVDSGMQAGGTNLIVTLAVAAVVVVLAVVVIVVVMVSRTGQDPSKKKE